MTVIAMLNFYDEPDLLIKRSVRGLARLGVTKIVACDGAYALRPDGKPRSSEQTIETLRQACFDRRLMLHLHQPDVVWEGNEVAKRQMMLDLTLIWANPDDWLAIWDCDYKLMSASKVEISFLLATTPCDVATIRFTENPMAEFQRDFYPMGMFLRARPGIKMDGNHHTYKFADGRRTQVLRRPVPNEADALHMPDVRILHAVHQRDPEQRERQAAYYLERDRLAVES